MAITMYNMKSKSAMNDINKVFTYSTVSQGNFVGEFDGYDGYIVVNMDATAMGNETAVGTRNYWRFTYGGMTKTYFECEAPTILTNGLCKIHIHLDVLVTYKNVIKEMSAIAVRNENKFNSMLVDSKIKTYANDKLVIKQFPNGFEGESYVMSISGGN